MGNATSCDSCASNIDCTPVISQNLGIPGVYTGMDETNAPDSKQVRRFAASLRLPVFHTSASLISLILAFNLCSLSFSPSDASKP